MRASKQLYIIIHTNFELVFLSTQVVIVLGWVDDEPSVHEEFIGLYEVPSIEASSLIFVIKDTRLRLNLTLARARGQCYDGASNMCVIRSGVAKQIQDEEPRALLTHCYDHSLSLAASDTIKKCKTMKSALETTHETSEIFPTKGKPFP